MRIHQAKWLVSSGLVLASGLWWAAQAATASKPTPLAAQVTAGTELYSKSCQGCHGDKLQGIRGPTLLGADFQKKWDNADKLHAKVSKDMPRSAPGSLSAQQYLEVVAFVLSKNGAALPASGLSKDNLKTWPISARQGQAKAGAAVFAKNCQGCHGDKLQGVAAPTLLGTDFLQKWQTVGQLHEKISKNMPRNAPGSLSEEQYLDVLAFVLDQNKAAGGNAALSKADFKTALK